MTKRVTVSLPDEIAAYLDAADNASAVVAEALRAQMDRSAATEVMLRAAGFPLAEDRPRAGLKPLTAEQRARIEQRREQLRSGNWMA